jgi:outer membrane protein OmpA-like peptidoglycan-associated protein
MAKSNRRTIRGAGFAALAAGTVVATSAAAQTTTRPMTAAPVPAPVYGVPSWSAQPLTGLYIGGNVGANWLMGYELHPEASIGRRLNAQGYNLTPGKTEFSTGIAGGAAIGWGFGNGLRAELEGSYRGNNVNSLNGFNITGPGVVAGPGISSTRLGSNPSGTQQTPAVMVNVLYDIHIPSVPWVIPYVGAGIGVGWVSVARQDLVARQAAAGVPSRIAMGGNDSSTQFAYQAIVGGAFPIESVPGLAATLEYRYFGTQRPKYNVTAYAAGTGATVATGSIKGFNNNNAILVGLRYAFNTPVPAVIPAAVAPAAARTFLVFFDWDKYNLTQRAREIIAQAAQVSKTTGTTRIEVGGHTDTTGSAQYNQALSIRRAEAVAAQLVRDGVPRNAIAISGYGFTRPLVPTGPNVREPQNRRVEIVLR